MKVHRTRGYIREQANLLWVRCGRHAGALFARLFFMLGFPHISYISAYLLLDTSAAL